MGQSRADLRIAPLSAQHRRKEFTCGIEALDQYLHRQARQDVRRKVNAVFILSALDAPQEILGYYTLCATAISQGAVPAAARKFVPRYPLVSATLIGRLAVARDRQGQGLGSLLMADALERAYLSADSVGSSMVVVDALDQRAAAFYVAHGFVPLPQSLRLLMPVRSIRDLIESGDR